MDERCRPADAFLFPRRAGGGGGGRRGERVKRGAEPVKMPAEADAELKCGGQLKTVRLKRRPGESFGFALRGGREHKLGFVVTQVQCGSESQLKGLTVLTGAPRLAATIRWSSAVEIDVVLIARLCLPGRRSGDAHQRTARRRSPAQRNAQHDSLENAGHPQSPQYVFLACLFLIMASTDGRCFPQVAVSIPSTEPTSKYGLVWGRVVDALRNAH